MASNELADAVRAYMDQNPEWRYSQAVFNALHQLDPDVANEIRGTDLDPFYMDERVPALLAWLRTRT